MARSEANRAKLTKTTVQRAQAQPGGEKFLWDTEVSRFGLRVSGRTGRKVYVIRYRNQHGRARKYTIGRSDDWRPEEARDEAKRLFREIDVNGADPAAGRIAARHAPTVGDLAARYMREHARPYKSEGSADSDDKTLKRHVLPRWRDRAAAEIERGDMMALMADLSATPVMANRVLALCSKMFNLAEAWRYRGQDTNPCRHVQKYTEESRYYFLDPEEIARLGKALRWADQQREGLQRVAALCRLLLITGRRPKEWLDARPEDVDLKRRTLAVGRDKGTKRAAFHYLPPEATDEVQRVLDVFEPEPGERLLGVTSYAKRWHEIRAQAELPANVRVYDCRHTYGSQAHESGGSLRAVGELLGHQQLSTTEIYTHVRDLQKQQHADRVGSQLHEYMQGDAAG